MESMLSKGRQVALAAGMVVALLGAAGVMASAHAFGGGPGGGQGMGMDAGPMGGRHGMMGAGRHLDRLLDVADASKEQRVKIKQIMAAAEEDMRAQSTSRSAHREELLKQLSQPKIDAGAVEKLRQQHLTQHDAASKRMTQAMLDVAAVLTPEQRVKVAQEMQRRQAQRQSRMESHGARGDGARSDAGK